MQKMKNEGFTGGRVWLGILLFTVFLWIGGGFYGVEAITLPSDTTITSSSVDKICPGITQTNLKLKKGDRAINEYVLTVDTQDPNVGIMTSYYKMAEELKNGTGHRETVSNQAKYVKSKMGLNVVAAVNGDFFNVSNGKPEGLLVMNKEKVYDGGLSYHYIALLENNEIVIRERGDSYDDAIDAMGFPNLLMKNGTIQFGANLDFTNAPRTALGTKANGEVVLLVVDGRTTASSGLNLYELALQLQSMGCVDGAMLDGGGSSTLVSCLPSEEELSVKSVPSDGNERAVGSSLLFYSKLQPVKLSSCKITMKKNLYYNGKSQKPVVRVYNGSTKLVEGTDYKVSYHNNKKIGTAYALVTGTGKTGVTGAVKVDFQIKLSKPADPRANASCTMKFLKVKWNKVMGAEQYYVYRSTTMTGNYKRIAKVSGGKLYYIDNTIQPKTRYYYRVKAYDANSKITSSYTGAIRARILPQSVAKVTCSRSSSKATIQFTSAKSVNGYQVYRSTSKQGTYQKVYEITNKGTLSFVNKGLSKKQTYYYKVRSYKVYKGKTYYSNSRLIIVPGL